MYPYRTTIVDNIVIEFFPPYLEKKFVKKHKVIIFCDGMPGLPGNSKTMEYYSKKGYWTLYPRYRGTWESGGEFLDHDPTEDILDVITAFDQPLISAFDGKEFMIKNPEVYLVGISFGGSAAILGSKDRRVKKSISLSGVIDWPAGEEVEPMEHLHHVVQKGFGNAYKYKKENWDRLARGELYNPIDQMNVFDPNKLFLIHAADDAVVPVGPARAFRREVGCTYLELKKGGHGSGSWLRRWRLARKILKFLEE